MNTDEDRKGLVLTCVQPTGQLHLGNYFGAIKNWVDNYLENYECLFGIVDMHAITVPYNPGDLRKNTLDCVAQYAACGLDPENCSIFVQSQIGLHSELAWILSCICPLGQLQRMTQFKDKSKKQENVSAGLLYYPVLMAADILVYNADIVPVGEDQKQHLELTRDLALKFNQTYSDTFKIPEPGILKVGSRIMSLQDPTLKMSKSDPNQMGVIYLWDEPKVIHKKIMNAVTDSGSDIVYSDGKPGISNLLEIMHLATGKSIKILEMEFQGKGYGDFKRAIADSIVKLLEPIQARYRVFCNDKEKLLQIVDSGAKNARRIATKTMRKVFRKVGYLQPQD